MKDTLLGQRFAHRHAAGVTRFQVDRTHRDAGYYECVAIRAVEGSHHFIGAINVFSRAEILSKLQGPAGGAVDAAPETSASKSTGTSQSPATAEQIYKAVRYVLDRIQDSPNVGYYCGFGTQIFYELIQAEAAFTGLPLDEVQERRRKDTEPEYRKTLPRVIQLEEKLADARRDCTCGGVQ